MTLSKEHRANIEAAIKATEYKYFGMYEFTEAQHDAVDLLVSVAQAMLDADTAGAKPQTDAEALYDAWQSTIAYMDEQRAATPASSVAEVAGLFQSATKRCDMGVGCDEAGVCYAEAHGQPDRCSKAIAATPASSAADAATKKRHETLERICEGITDEMIDGGWTANGIRRYAKSLEEKIAAGASERADAEKDAARYRWLRDNCFDWEEPGEGDSFGLASLHYEADDLGYSVDSLDSSIDAAILAANGEKP